MNKREVINRISIIEDKIDDLRDEMYHEIAKLEELDSRFDKLKLHLKSLKDKIEE